MNQHVHRSFVTSVQTPGAAAGISLVCVNWLRVLYCADEGQTLSSLAITDLSVQETMSHYRTHRQPNGLDG